MDQKTDGPGGEALASCRPTLYKCPYCVRRFTDPNGWEEAKRHIREKHQKDTYNGIRRDRRGLAAAGSDDTEEKLPKREGLFDNEP